MNTGLHSLISLRKPMAAAAFAPVIVAMAQAQTTPPPQPAQSLTTQTPAPSGATAMNPSHGGEINSQAKTGPAIADAKKKNYELGLQLTVLPQSMTPFHDPYIGKNGMLSYTGTRTTESLTAYLGAKLTPNIQAYLNPEWVKGEGLGNVSGVAAFPNNEIVRIGVQPVPYIGRAFVRGIVPLSKDRIELEPDENQIGGSYPEHAVVLTFGKLAAGDIFDKNSYANSGRTQFMNWALVNNEAYDYDADTRGYTFGGAAEWTNPSWTFRLGEFQEPTKANGPELATNMSKDYGQQAEFEWKPDTKSVFRFLAYRNVAHMGNYEDALALAAQTNSVPNIQAVERDGEFKYGYGLNFERALGDDGDTGVFARLGWNNGATESYAFTEADSTISAGLQVSGKRWKIAGDHAAFALVMGGLSSAHEAYLEAGGTGFQLGSGKLNYANEEVFETYYTHSFGKLLQASLDFQAIQNPGYNRDMGTIPVISARIHFEF